MSGAQNPARNAALALCLVSALLLLATLGIALNRSGLVTPRVGASRVESIRPESGFAYVANIEDRRPWAARFVAPELLEDGEPLVGPRKAPLATIREVGAGRYALDRERVVFSTSDNSDPRSNGRRYTVSYPVQLGSRPARLLAAVSTFSVAITTLWLSALFCLRLARAWKEWRESRAGTEPQPGSGPDWRRRAAIALFCCVSLPVLFLAHGERSPWVLTTTPDGYPQPLGNSLLGYTYVTGDVPFMIENVYYVDQVLAYGGDSSRLSTYFPYRRALTPFLCTLLAPFLGAIGSILAASYLAWAVAAAAAWRLAKRLHDAPLAPPIAVAFVSTSIGFVSHLHDYSPHLTAFTFYYVGVVAVFESGVWRETRPLRTHLALALFIALASINYSSGMFLVAGYALVAFTRNRWWHVALASSIGAGAQFAYLKFLRALARAATGQALPVETSESSLVVGKTIEIWLASMSSPGRFVETALLAASQFSFIEFPPLLFLGLLAWVCFRRHRRLVLFFAVFFFVPVLVMLALFSWAGARGYPVFGISLLLYVPLAVAAARTLCDPRRAIRVAAAVAVVCLLGAQLLWSTAFLWGSLVPLKAFMGNGIDAVSWLDFMRSAGLERPPALSLTGLEPTPVLFGGDATLVEAGMLPTASWAVMPAYSTPFALASRSFCAALCVALAWIAIPDPRNRKLAAGAAVLGLWLIPSLLAQALPPRSLSVALDGVDVAAGERIEYSVAVSDELVAGLRLAASGDAAVEARFACSSPVELRLRGGDGRLLLDVADARYAYPYSFDLVERELFSSLAQSRRLTVEVSNAGPETATCWGWQRKALGARTVVHSDASGRQKPLPADSVLPSFELRVVSAKRGLRFAGF